MLSCCVVKVVGSFNDAICKTHTTKYGSNMLDLTLYKVTMLVFKRNCIFKSFLTKVRIFIDKY